MMQESFFLNEREHKPRKVSLAMGLLGFMQQVGQKDLINLAAGVPAPELLPVEELKKAFRLATQKAGLSMWAYQTPSGHGPLRMTMAARLGARGLKITGEDVLITTGCTQALHLALQTLVRPGDIVACESPCYYNTLEQISAAGGLALPLPSNANTGLVLKSAEALLKKYRPKVLVLCSTLSNPTGASIPEEDRPRWVQLARRLGLTIIEDDIYAELCEGIVPPPLRAFDDGSHVLYVSSFCKTVSPGLRVGCAVPGKWMQPMLERKCMADLHSSLVSEATLDAFLCSPAMGKHLVNLQKTCALKRALGTKAVRDYFPEGTLISEPRGGFILWVQLAKKINMKMLEAKALQEGVSFAKGEVFACATTRVSAMRLNCARVSEAQLVKGIKILGGLIKSSAKVKEKLKT
jgi:DNA-binding transcriptional MocR family regulator